MAKPRSGTSTIARRFILSIVLFSTFITVFITSIQLYRDYNSDMKLIQNDLEQINNVHLNSLTSALWASNQKLLQTSVEGILETRDIQYVEIRDDEKTWVKVGVVKKGHNIQRKFEMNYRYKNKEINIGSLIVNVDLEGVYQRLLNKVWVILVSNGIKTSLVAFFIYFLFYQLVARHLSTISEYSEKHALLSHRNLLVLDRNSKTHDEFDAVVNSINEMQTRLHDQILEIDNQKQYLSRTLNSIGDAVITTDDQGFVERLNPVAEKLTGWTNAEAQKQPLNKIFPIFDASTRKPIESPIEKVLTTGETVYLSDHTTLVSKNGTEYQIADSAAPIRSGDKILGVVLIFNNVTEQYQLREALHESEKKLRLIHSQVPGIVYQFRLDTAGQRSLPYVSPAVEDYIGVKAEVVMAEAERWFELTHPDDYLGLEKSILESFNALSLWEWEGRFVRHDGKVVWLRGKSTPERLKDGSTLWNGLFIDVTERILQEEQLRRSQKMDALGKLTGGIAHDYNNILGVVLGYAEQIFEHKNDAEMVASYSKNIKHSAERGSKLAKKLLAFSRNKQPEVTVINLNHLLQEQQDLLGKTLTVKHQLNLNLEDDLWFIELDNSDLEDAILNLCINARDAMNESSGQLSIETHNVKLSDTSVQHLDLKTGDYVALDIIDTGSGMDNATKERIFDPFYTTKGEKGTGLGLSQVYGFVKRSSGAIKLNSELGHGSRFTMFFPRVYKSPTENKKSSSTIKNIGGNETLLVVDDERDIVKLLDGIFSAQGYQVLTACDAKQALAVFEKADRENRKIDLMLSDVIMPNMDGYQLAALVRKRYPNTKIQMLSGFSDERHVGVVDEDLHINMLAKPYSTNTLLEVVRNLLDKPDQVDILSNRTILIMDDDEDIQTLYTIRLKKLGCKVISTFNGESAIKVYKDAFDKGKPIDLMIVDLNIPSGMGGKEVTNEIRKFHPNAKIIVASGNLEEPAVLKPRDHHFDAALDKDANQEEIKKKLEEVLLS